MLLYYKNYNDIIKKLDKDECFEESIIEMIKEHRKDGTFIKSVYE
jgi:hypothetical protein